MTWTYSGNPASSNKDAVRFLVSDTDTNNQLVNDEEITYVLNQEGTVYQAAARVARTIAAYFGRKADKSVGDLKISYKSQNEFYLKLASELQQNSKVYASPYAGGISESDKDTVEDDTDRVEPSFRRGLHDHREAGYEDDDDICDRNN